MRGGGGETDIPKRETEKRMIMTHTRDMISVERSMVNAGDFPALALGGCGVVDPM